MKKEFPKVLIIGTTPYSPNESSRALDTYFHNWPKERLAMIYSNNILPPNDFCGAYFRITDFELFKKIFNRKVKSGSPICYCQDKDATLKKQKKNAIVEKLKKKTTMRFYLRKFIWKKKRWLSDSLEQWVASFDPDIIYICFSDDYFILDIARYFSNKYNLPTISQIGDDYYFKKYNFLMKKYITSYKKLFLDIMNEDGFGVYISDKLADKYNSSFKKQGFPIYLSSDIKIDLPAKPIEYKFNYFGKINLGRDKTLMILGDALTTINPSFKINFFCNPISNKLNKKFVKHGCVYGGFLTHDEVIDTMSSGSFNIIASGFSKKNIEDARYSLSTKVSDSLASPGPIIAIGPNGDGAIDFLKEKQCAIVVDEQIIDCEKLSAKIMNLDLLRKNINKAREVFINMNDKTKNRERFENACFNLTFSQEKK